MHVYRAVAGVNHESGMADAADIEQLGAIAPLVVIRLARVTLAVRVASLAPAALQALLCQARPRPRSWLRALEEDLVWFAGMTTDFVRRRSPCGGRRFAGNRWRKEGRSLQPPALSRRGRRKDGQPLRPSASLSSSIHAVSAERCPLPGRRWPSMGSRRTAVPLLHGGTPEQPFAPSAYLSFTPATASLRILVRAACAV